MRSAEPDSTPDDLAALTERVIAEDEATGATAGPLVLPDDLLPGVGGEPVSLKRARRVGGTSTLLVLTLIVVAATVERSALTVLAPDIQRSLGLSDAALAAITGASGALLVLGAVPFGVLGDRFSRPRVSAIATATWGVLLALSALTVNAFQLFVVRLGVGLGQADELPIHGSLLADRYPLGARARVYATHGASGPVGSFVGPILVGALAAAIGGGDAWRWVFAVLGIPPLVLSLVLARLPDPRRGVNEQEAVLGEVLATGDELPVSMSSAFERLRRIRTFHFVLLAFAVLGFALFSAPLLTSLFLENRFGLDALERGLVFSIGALASLAVLPVVANRVDGMLRRRPGSVLHLTSSLVAAYGVFYVAALFMPGVVGLTAVLALANAAAIGAFVSLSPVTAAVVPYRLRSQGYALTGVYLFLFGAVGGLLLGGLLSDAFGERAALVTIIPVATLVGAVLVAVGARHVAGDISLVVEELREEQREARRRAESGTAPVLEVVNLDFSYGTVQVLFDIALEVGRGEVVALVGTNGAGKSTLLRVISGLGVPERGVVRFEGRTVTLVDVERRVGLGIVQVRGGQGVFPELSVDDNLRAFLVASRLPAQVREDRIRKVFETFPALVAHRATPAQSLSGGLQQQLAISLALLRDPVLLIIDELSLGLAPIVVEELLTIVERLRAQGISMLIVEQSLNVAAAISDRAVFMEKGSVRFVGPARDLLERDELARAVFFGDTSR